MNVVELLDRQAEVRLDQPALRHGRQVISFGDLGEQSRRGANYLRSRGFQEGDVALVFVPMSIDLYCILLSLWRIGMTAMFVDPATDDQRLQECCNRANPTGFIGTLPACLLRLKRSALRRIGTVVTTGRLPLPTSWSRRHRFPLTGDTVACGDDTPALITFTSGSTGTPKGTVRTHGFLMAQKRVLEKTLGLQPGKSDLATLPIFALINLACGVTTIIPPVSLKKPAQVATAPILRECAIHRPATAVASPAFFERLLGDENRAHLRCLEALYTGGAPVFPGLLEKLAGALPNTSCTAVYGSTEAEPIAELAYGDIALEDRRRMAEGAGLLAGEVVEDTLCHIIDNRWGEPLGSITDEVFHQMTRPPGQPGEIVVHGNHVLTGYLDGIGDDDNKFSVEGRIWHRTGDLGYFDTTGRLWLLGRCLAAITDSRGVAYPFAVETAARHTVGVNKAAFCQLAGKRVLVIEAGSAFDQGGTTLQPVIATFHIDRVVLAEIPMDSRHNAKVNYPELVEMLNQEKFQVLSIHTT